MDVATMGILSLATVLQLNLRLCSVCNVMRTPRHTVHMFHTEKAHAHLFTAYMKTVFCLCFCESQITRRASM